MLESSGTANRCIRSIYQSLKIFIRKRKSLSCVSFQHKTDFGSSRASFPLPRSPLRFGLGVLGELGHVRGRGKAGNEGGHLMRERTAVSPESGFRSGRPRAASDLAASQPPGPPGRPSGLGVSLLEISRQSLNTRSALGQVFLPTYG